MELIDDRLAMEMNEVPTRVHDLDIDCHDTGHRSNSDSECYSVMSPSFEGT